MNKMRLNKRSTLKGALVIALTALLLAVVVPWISSNAMAGDNNETDNVKEGLNDVFSVQVTPASCSPSSTPQDFKFSGSFDTAADIFDEDSYIVIKDSKQDEIFKSSFEKLKVKFNPSNESWSSDPQQIKIDTIGDYDVTCSFHDSGKEIASASCKIECKEPTPPGDQKIVTVNLDGGSVDSSSAEKLKFASWTEKGKGIWQKDCSSVQGITYKIALNVWDSPDVTVTKDGQKRTGWNPAPDDSPVTQSTTFTAVYGQGNSQVDNPTDPAQTSDSTALLIFGLITCAIACSVLATRKLKANKR